MALGISAQAVLAAADSKAPAPQVAAIPTTLLTHYLVIVLKKETFICHCTLDK